MEEVVMATLFFPGCNPKADHPEASAKLAEYIKDKFGVDPVGCCRVDHPKLTSQDTAGGGCCRYRICPLPVMTYL